MRSLRTSMGMVVLAALALNTAALADSAVSLPESRRAALLSSDSCQNVIRSDDQHLYIGYGPYLPRENTHGRVQVIDLENPEKKSNLTTRDSVVDIAPVGNRLFILTFSALEEWNLTTLQFVATYPTYLTPDQMKYREHAKGLYFYNNRFYIAHGRLGFSVFDITKNHIVEQHRILSEQLPLESQVVDIAGAGDKAILAIDNFSEPAHGKVAFRGLAVLDLKTLSIVQKIDGIDPGAEGVNVINDSVFVTNFASIWKYSLREVLRGSGAQPQRVVSHFQGKDDFLVKKVLFDETHLYACFNERLDFNQYVMKPRVFDRKELGLD